MPDEAGSVAVPNVVTHATLTRPRRLDPSPSWKNRLWRTGDASPNNRWRGAAVSLAITGLITILGFWIEPFIRAPNLAILYMLGVVFVAVRWGRWPVIVNAVSSALLFDYFFIPPVRSFVIGDVWYSITLIGLLAVGLIVNTLIGAARDEALLAQRRAEHVSALYSFMQSVASGNGLDRIMGGVARHFMEMFQRPIVVLLPGEEGLSVGFASAEMMFDEAESRIASWVFENGQEAGYGTEMFSGSGICYRPLKTGSGIVGVIGFQGKSSQGLLPPDQLDLLSIFLDQTALAITRADLARKAKRAEALQETDRLQKALLNSVSHNLRSPLSSVLGVLSTILEDGSLLDAFTQQSLLRTAQKEARQLDWLIQNLLDMTRLESGAIRVRADLCDMHDVVAAALRQLGEPAGCSRILANIPPGLPLVPMDGILMVQVLVNLLDNALKYSGGDAPVEIQVRLDTGQLEIRVLDRGRGIPEGELERVFDRFYRVAVPGAPRGTGLGLSICRGFVEAHNGRILAMRRAQGGTEVALFLPLEART